MRDWIIKDFWWKLFSVFLAVAIWLTVHKVREDPPPVTPASNNTLTYGSVPVLVVSAASDVRNVHALPGTVTVTVSGPPEIMSQLQANQIHPIINLTDIAGAAYNLKLHVEVSAPPGVTLVSVDPPEVGVLFPPVNDNKP